MEVSLNLSHSHWQREHQRMLFSGLDESCLYDWLLIPSREWSLPKVPGVFKFPVRMADPFIDEVCHTALLRTRGGQHWVPKGRYQTWLIEKSVKVTVGLDPSGARKPLPAPLAGGALLSIFLPPPTDREPSADAFDSFLPGLLSSITSSIFPPILIPTVFPHFSLGLPASDTDHWEGSQISAPGGPSAKHSWAWSWPSSMALLPVCDDLWPDLWPPMQWETLCKCTRRPLEQILGSEFASEDWCVGSQRISVFQFCKKIPSFGISWTIINTAAILMIFCFFISLFYFRNTEWIVSSLHLQPAILWINSSE